ncbi:MAG: toll/interleukin-1 receptor domain-containing protein [Odoribacter sp.]|nr:toll/interleukin-1 receptor domain-containing protein [Odoribacter sp.]
MDRDTLFISHATPEDNEFSIWIASHLEMLGYKTWIDKEGLLGGERFWATIQKAIQSSIKVLFVYSNNIVTKEGILKQGIENEIEYAKSIASQFNLQDFIIPLHIDDSSYNLAIGLPNINHIPFANNWAEGLKILKKKLEKDNVP